MTARRGGAMPDSGSPPATTAHPAGSRSPWTGRLWWSAIGAIALVLGFAAVTRMVAGDRRGSVAQDDVRVVTGGTARDARTVVYSYQAPRIAPSPGGGPVAVPEIDDSSSLDAYRQSCLAALTRGRNPEIMALSDAQRADMCTDPRRQ